MGLEMTDFLPAAGQPEAFAGSFPASHDTLGQAKRRMALSEAFAGAFNASPAVQGQSKSRETFKWLIETDNKPAWWPDFDEIREEFPHFKKWEIWSLIAWASMHAGLRDPRTLQEFADSINTSTRTLLTYRTKTWGDKPTVDEAIATVKSGSMWHRRRKVLTALGDVAEMPDPKAHPDRKMFLEMTGDYPARPRPEPDLTIDETFTKRLEQIYQDDGDIIDLPALDAD